MVLQNHRFIAAGLAFFMSLVFAFIIGKRNEIDFTLEFEELFNQLKWPSAARFMRILAKTVSLSNRREKAELIRFISSRKEIERQVQRYQYFADKKAALGRKLRKSNVHSLDEEQMSLWETADTELEILPYRVYKLILSLEDYTNFYPGGNQWQRNSWIREYISLHKERHRHFDREICARRLGCCAASCGCCDRPRRSKGFMRMVRRKYLGNLAHCSVDCGCCIQRRGFWMPEEEASVKP